jgi:hypothetical protein
MTYRELLEQLRGQGYEIISTGGTTETLNQHLAGLEVDFGEAIYGESKDPYKVCLLIYDLPDRGHPLCQVYRTADYVRYLAQHDWDVDRELRRLGLLLTSTEAANLLGVHRDTTRRVAAAGQVDGAHLITLPGVLGQVWVAIRSAWQQWFDNRRPAGRPKRDPNE